MLARGFARRINSLKNFQMEGKRKMKRALKLALVLGMATAAEGAMAASEGWYAGIGIGQSKVSDWLSKDDARDVQSAFEDGVGVLAFSGSTTASSDDKDTGWKVYGGYQFNENLAVEASYLNLGKTTAQSSSTGRFFISGIGVVNGSLYTKTTGEASAFTLDGVVKADLAPWVDIFAKAGAYRAKLDVKLTGGITGSAGSAEASDSMDDDSTGLHIALGADFNIIENVAIRAEWERLSKVDFQDSETDIDLLSVSAIYKF